MKYLIKQSTPRIPFFLLLGAFLLSCNGNNKTSKAIPIIKSGVESITFKIDGASHSTWNVMPELNPDRLPVECKLEKVNVQFITDIDSIEFAIGQGDTVQFYVLLKGQDSALTEIVGIPKNANFSDEYVQLHKGKFEVEIPEVHELANVMVAICKIGQLDSNMIDMTTRYHSEVLTHFQAYTAHPAIEIINKYITGVMDEKSYWYYYALKMNACGYLFDEDNGIIDDEIIHKMGFEGLEDPFIKDKELFANFAEQSDFRQFYSDHKGYYDSLVDTYKHLNPIDKMQRWLESKFTFGYGNYHVTFSPLVGGAHSTQRFEDNGFEKTVMFVCRAEPSPKYNQNVNEMLDSRIVFTEIDHNFVNPISNNHLTQITNAISDREKWVKEGDGTSSYSSSYHVFNEYMTWAIFSLYCLDNFPIADVAQFVPIMETQMAKQRGFRKFDEFNQKLITLYQNDPNLNIDTLYKQILTWCEKQ